MIEATTRADLQASIGKTVRVVGVPANTKASPGLKLADGSWVNCGIGSTHWPQEYADKNVVVTGVVSQQTAPSYPVATRDKDGNWSQGVTVPTLLLPGEFGDDEPFRAVEPSFGDAELIIQVTTHSPLP